MMKIVNRQLPKGWDKMAHQHWCRGHRKEAISAILNVINAYGQKKPLVFVLQFSYYLFLTGEIRAAAQVVEASLDHYPDNTTLLLNLGVYLSRSGQYENAIVHLKKLLSLKPDDYVGFDSLCHCYYKLGLFELATVAGKKALHNKDKLVKVDACNVPVESPSEWLTSFDKENVISFSLWGNNPRYLRGAVDNVLAAEHIYPGWRVRIYIDHSVPLDVQNLLLTMNVDLRLEAPNQSMLQRLTWRFKVVNDANVGRFLIRDIDSVINQREKRAVEQWIASDNWFHVMRDWWTHTDLILAGMWGGIANVLPSMELMINNYSPPSMETPNIDQWFLRDNIWGMIRDHCLVHDRCFNTEKTISWPSDDSSSNYHVGQDVFTVNRKSQAIRLKEWINKIKSLQ